MYSLVKQRMGAQESGVFHKSCYINSMNLPALPADASSDQSNCPPDYYRRSNGMLHQITINTAPNVGQSPLTAAELAKLSEMDREGLLSLIRLCDAKKVRYAMLTKEEKRERLKLRIYGIAEDSDNEPVVIKAANDWLDREDGKAMQQIRQETNIMGSIAMISGDEVSQIIEGWLANPLFVVDNV